MSSICHVVISYRSIAMIGVIPGNKGTSAEAHKKDFFIPREQWVFLDDKARAILYGRESTNFSNELPPTQRPLTNMHNYSVPQEKG